METLEEVMRRYPQTSVFFQAEFLPRIQRIRQQLESNIGPEIVGAEIAQCREIYIRLLTMPGLDLGVRNIDYVTRIVKIAMNEDRAVLLKGMELAFETAYHQELPGSKARALEYWDTTVKGLLENLQVLLNR